MADFRTKLITLAGVATMFAGAAFGQATFAPNSSTAVGGTVGFVRAEGTTELLPSTTVGLSGAVAGTITLTAYLSPTVTITSEVYGSSTKTSEITATSNGVGGGTVPGVVSGSTVTFANIPTGTTTTSVTISNIRVNATSIAVASGVPTGISELFFLAGANATPGAASPYTIAYVLNGLGAVSVPSSGTGAPTSNLICAAVSNATLQFTVNVPENFSLAFKTLAQESGTNTNAPATNGTRLAVTIANVPANVSVYVPLSVANSATGGSGVLTLISSPTAAFAAATAAGTTAPLTTYGAVTIANGTGTAYYELTTATTAGILENYPINVYYSSKAAVLTAPATAATASVSFAPIGSTTNYPNFAVGTSTTTVSGSTYAACSTTLLFPFVTNQLGFDTGIAISNTSSDLLGVKNGAAISAAAPQTGTCSLTFFGASAPSAAVTTAPVTAGTTYAAAASGLAPGFQGYVFASCNFLYAHGFAYVVYDLTQNNGAAMGYLADVLPSPNTSSAGSGRLSSVVSVSGTITAGVGTVSSALATVGSASPESWGH